MGQTGFKTNLKLWRYGQNYKPPRYHDIIILLMILPLPISAPLFKHACCPTVLSPFLLPLPLGKYLDHVVFLSPVIKISITSRHLRFLCACQNHNIQFLVSAVNSQWPCILHGARMPLRLFACLSGWLQKSLGTNDVLASMSQIQGTVPRFLWQVQQPIHSNACANTWVVFTYEKSNSG